MGYLSNSHIRKFVEGKTIRSLVKNEGRNEFTLEFTDGQKLFLYPYVTNKTDRDGYGGINLSIVPEIIATPLNEIGVIIQSTEIEGN